MADVDWNEVLGESDAVIVVYIHDGVIRNRMEGKYPLIFDKLLGPEPDSFYED